MAALGEIRAGPLERGEKQSAQRRFSKPQSHVMTMDIFCWSNKNKDEFKGRDPAAGEEVFAKGRLACRRREKERRDDR